MTYSAAPSIDGKLNTTSLFDNNNNLKTTFWNFAGALLGTTPTDDIGLTSNHTPDLTARSLVYVPEHNWWEASGLPITPYNDDASKDYYPMVNVIAKDSAGNVLATTKVVLPVSDEMDCRACHGSQSGTIAECTSCHTITHTVCTLSDSTGSMPMKMLLKIILGNVKAVTVRTTGEVSFPKHFRHALSQPSGERKT